MSAHLGMWATAIVNNSATLTCPPHTPEFDSIIYGPSKSSTKAEMAGFTTAPSLAPIVHYNLVPPHSSDALSSSPKKKRQRRSTIQINSSPLGTYSSRDYYGSALQDYTSWCARKYRDDEFNEAFAKLREHKVGVDLIEDMETSTLISLCGLSHGTATRLKTNVLKWKASLKAYSNVIYLNIAMAILISSNLWRNYYSRHLQNFICQFLKTFGALDTMLWGSP